jgi:hypothetical protein
MVEEEALLVGPDMPDKQVRLNRVFVEEVLRRLHQADRGIMEQRHGAPQEIALRHEICVEYGDEFGRSGLRAKIVQRVVDVAGLRVAVVGPSEVMRALGGAERFEPGSPTIIQDPHPNPRKIDPERADDGALQDCFFFVVGSDQEIDPRQLRQGVEPGRLLDELGATVLRAAQGYKAQGPAENRRRLYRRKRPGIQGADGKAEGRQGLGEPPPQITPREEDADPEQDGARPFVLLIEKWQGYHQAAGDGEGQRKLIHRRWPASAEPEKIPHAFDEPSRESLASALEGHLAGTPDGTAVVGVLAKIIQLNRDLVPSLLRRDREAPAG